MRSITLLLALVALAGCLEPDAGAPATPPTTTPTTPTPRAETLEMRTLEKGSFSPIDEDLQRLIRDGETWDVVWSFHNEDEFAPEVDFPNEMVIAVVVHGPTGCGAMHLGSVVHDAEAGTITTTIVLEIAPENVQCLVAFEDVYHFVAVPAREGEPRFVTTEGPQPEEEPTPTTVPTPSAPEGNYSFRTLAQGGSSGITDMRREVVADIDAWRALWQEHTSITDPAPPMPEVDWERERVFIATAGDRSNTCWAIRVDHIDVRERNVEVQVTTIQPNAEMACGMAISQPYHFVTYPLTNKPILVHDGV